MSFLKKKSVKIGLFISILLLFAYSFFLKFFPVEKGEWQENLDFKEQSAGFDRENFWLSVDYPGSQKVCFSFSLKDSLLSKANFKIEAQKTKRVATYEKSGSIADLFAKETIEKTEEKIQKEQPIILGNLKDRIAKDGKNTFLLGEKEKFLIPNRSIFKTYFPRGLEIPEKDTSALDYSNKLIGFPDGLLFSHNEGVFVSSNRNLSLIRSPEVFEALGYDWGQIQKIDDFEYDLSVPGKVSLVDFNFTHPNGTILKMEDKLFLVFEEKLFELTLSEKEKYFSNHPIIETHPEKLSLTCKSEPKSLDCCSPYFNPYFESSGKNLQNGTLYFNLPENLKKEDIKKVEWQSKIQINQSNFLRRAKSFKNYLLAQFGLI